jgi:hypothetical protein
VGRIGVTCASTVLSVMESRYAIAPVGQTLGDQGEDVDRVRHEQEGVVERADRAVLGSHVALLRSDPHVGGAERLDAQGVDPALPGENGTPSKSPRS